VGAGGLVAIPFLFVVGCAFGLVVLRRGNLVAASVGHAAWNAHVMLLATWSA
jgi:membrane protease YdiL (CAAX protease family)